MQRTQNTSAELDAEWPAPSETAAPAGLAAFPDQRQAWRVVLGLTLVLCVGFGTTLNSLGVFMLPISATFGCSNAQAGFLATAFIFSMTLATPVVGWLLDRIAPRAVMVSGAALTALANLLGAHSADIGQLTLAMALSGAGIGASTYVPAIILASRWITPRRQGLAFGVLLAGASVGAMLFPMLLTEAIGRLGWRDTMQAIALLLLVVCVPLPLVLARVPPAQGTDPAQPADAHSTGAGIGDALRTPTYWWWIAMQTLLILSSIGIFINLVPYLVSAGFDASTAAAFLAGTSGAAMLGNFVFGLISSRYSARNILLLGTLIGTVGLLCLLGAPLPKLGTGAIVLFALLWGATFNLVNQLAPLLLVDIMGQRNFGSLLGIGNLISGLVAAFGPEAVGYVVDRAHSYTPALLACGALMLLALPSISKQRPDRP
ncbi:MFS transporter [Pseudomonas sp. SCB32]|uniref:MFS transporter n=1 Tax=Pseudomonas sp. SCB32 TaxID=2653853 RepID=UPI0012643AA1|nr:MFS transporter [Pseudomonas sp. SCB32]